MKNNTIEAYLGYKVTLDIPTLLKAVEKLEELVVETIEYLNKIKGEFNK